MKLKEENKKYSKKELLDNKKKKILDNNNEILKSHVLQGTRQGI
jgi:hypothetical protein